ncbi:hypothetical protein [Carnobacterium maltaromaticum]|uniref:hypothetical protein n=1 Tax=Carnobacterium maltaromaticum TaxID=2751 RepID=UPI00295E5918|nr:hypothetical protein [Carnobacterium maltaromaticum]
MKKETSLVKLVEQGKVRAEAYYFDVETNTFIGNGRDFQTDIVNNYYLNQELKKEEK